VVQRSVAVGVSLVEGVEQGKQGVNLIGGERVNLVIVRPRQLHPLTGVHGDQAVSDRHIKRHAQQGKALRML